MTRLPTLAIELDKTRHLRYDWAAIREIESQTGVKIGEFSKLFDPPSITNLLTVLWAGLVHEDPDLTERDVGRMIYGDKSEEVMTKIGEALALGLGGGENDRPTTAQTVSGAGESSTTSPMARSR